VAACLTAGDDDGVRATCDEASDDGREAATSGGDAGDGGDDGSDEPLRRWKKSKNKSRSVRGWKGKRRRAGRGCLEVVGWRRRRSIHRRALRVWHPLPYRSATRRTHGLLAFGILLRSLCQRARAPHAYFTAPVRGRRAV
jgi:hypothetical protein